MVWAAQELPHQYLDRQLLMAAVVVQVLLLLQQLLVLVGQGVAVLAVHQMQMVLQVQPIQAVVVAVQVVVQVAH
jgi:hypothetical protein